MMCPNMLFGARIGGVDGRAALSHAALAVVGERDSTPPGVCGSTAIHSGRSIFVAPSDVARPGAS